MFEEHVSIQSFEIPGFQQYSAWTEHIPFSFWLLEQHRPKTVVSWGTHSGIAYFSFCQSIKVNDIPAVCYGLDNWPGDNSILSNNGSLRQVEKYNRENYADFSSLLPGSSKTADLFPDKSVDLLYLDDIPDYETAKKNFARWLPKLSGSSLVLFHGIGIRKQQSGISRLWEALSKEYPSFSFVHANGLGILAIGTILPPRLLSLFSLPETDIKKLRNVYSRLGHSLSEKFELSISKDQLGDLTSQLAILNASLEISEKELNAISSNNKDLTQKLEEITILKKQTEALEQSIASLTNASGQKDQEIERQQILLEWYKRTYEERSFPGVMKEKLKRGFQNLYMRLTKRLLATNFIRKKYLLTYLLEFIRDHGLNKFTRYSLHELRKNKFRTFTGFRQIILKKNTGINIKELIAVWMSYKLLYYK